MSGSLSFGGDEKVMGCEGSHQMECPRAGCAWADGRPRVLSLLCVCLDSSLTACSGVESTAAPQKLLILDARSYTAAVANRAKGGGCECEGIAVTSATAASLCSGGFGDSLCGGKSQTNLAWEQDSATQWLGLCLNCFICLSLTFSSVKWG